MIFTKAREKDSTYEEERKNVINSGSRAENILVLSIIPKG